MRTITLTRNVAMTALMILMPVVAVLGWTDYGYADGSPDIASGGRGSSQVELPRSFQGVRLGMGRVELLRTMHTGSTSTVSQGDVVVVPGRDRYIKRVEYGFHKGALYRIFAQYRPDKIPGGVDAFIMRLKETYGEPVVDGALTFAPAPGILSEKRIVWNDGRTEIAYTERERDIDLRPEIALVMTDLQLAQMRDEAMHERQEDRLRDVPIPMPDRSTSNRTAGIASGLPDGTARPARS